MRGREGEEREGEEREGGGREEEEEEERKYEEDTCMITFYNRDGRSLTNSEITGLLIGLLMAGQHTSSSTSSWIGFFLAREKHYQVRERERKRERR